MRFQRGLRTLSRIGPRDIHLIVVWKLCADYARAEEAAVTVEEISTNEVKSFVLHWDNRNMFLQDQYTEATKSARLHSELVLERGHV